MYIYVSFYQIMFAIKNNLVIYYLNIWAFSPHSGKNWNDTLNYKLRLNIHRKHTNRNINL